MFIFSKIWSIHFSTDSHTTLLLWRCNNNMNIWFHLVKLLILASKNEKEKVQNNSQSLGLKKKKSKKVCFASLFSSQQSFKTDWEKEMDNLSHQSQNYWRIMPIFGGRDNHPQCGKLRTNVLLFLLWRLQLTHHVRVPWPLPYRSCCALFCLFCSFWSFLAALLQCAPKSRSNPLSSMRWCLSHAGCQGAQNRCFDEWVSRFWGELKGALPVYLLRKRLGIALKADAVWISLQPFQLFSLWDESWHPAPRFVNLKSNQQNLWVNFTKSGNDFVWVLQQKKYSTKRNICPSMCKL